MSGWRVGLVTAVLISSFLVGCAVQGEEEFEVKPPLDTPTQFMGNVVDYGLGEGPILCDGAVAASDPPQCGGYSLIGWNWEIIEHEEFPASNDDDSQEMPIRSGDYSFDGTLYENDQIEVFPETVEAVESIIP